MMALCVDVLAQLRKLYKEQWDEPPPGYLTDEDLRVLTADDCSVGYDELFCSHLTSLRRWLTAARIRTVELETEIERVAVFLAVHNFPGYSLGPVEPVDQGSEFPNSMRVCPVCGKQSSRTKKHQHRKKICDDCASPNLTRVRRFRAKGE